MMATANAPRTDTSGISQKSSFSASTCGAEARLREQRGTSSPNPRSLRNPRHGQTWPTEFAGALVVRPLFMRLAQRVLIPLL